ncbi:MAG TPA: amino acid ABC transporter permease [Caldisericia bacterium]|nr:amino acid ABC transporter permease [Caldisericia bacterium]
MGFDFNISLFMESIPYLINGAKYTILFSLISIVFGILIGLFASLMKISKNPFFNILGNLYIEIIRGTPLLLHIMIAYYGLVAFKINLNYFTAGVLALSINSGAYCGEIFRAGIESIEKGQMEAARSVGMSYGQAMRFIIIPQAIKRVIPPLTNEFVAMLKDSSLLSIIAVPELLRNARQIMGTKLNVWSPFLGAALIYLVLTLPLTRLASVLERRFAKGGV